MAVGGIVGRFAERSREAPPVPPRRFARLENSPAWRASLELLGGLLVALGVLVGLGLGTATAVGGFVIFLATGVVAGAESYEVATALGASGMAFTAAGISVVTGGDPSLGLSLLGFEVAGGVLLIGGLAASRRRVGRAGD